MSAMDIWLRVHFGNDEQKGNMKLTKTHISDLVIIEPDVFPDERGFFMESFHAGKFADAGLPTNFVQDNHSRSEFGVIRGLHFQWEPPQAKLMRVPVGKAFVVAVDIRKNSPTLGKWHGTIISEDDKRMVFAPVGFARGFCALADRTEVQYKVTGLYNQQCESGILWNDSEIGIKWPIENPILSEKDANAQTLAKWLNRPESNNF